MKMDRILLKLSGEALAGEKHTGFDEAVVRDVAKQVKAICDKHIQVSIVIGGGNFWRGRTSDNMDRVKADQIGMLATVMNCIYAADAMRAEGLKTHIMTPFACGSMTELMAIEVEADVILSAKAIDGVYDSDPKTNPNAKKYDTMPISEIVDKKLGVIDLAAAVLAMENKMPMMLFGLNDTNSIEKAVTGGFTGTTVTVE